MGENNTKGLGLAHDLEPGKVYVYTTNQNKKTLFKFLGGRTGSSLERPAYRFKIVYPARYVDHTSPYNLPGDDPDIYTIPKTTMDDMIYHGGKLEPLKEKALWAKIMLKG